MTAFLDCFDNILPAEGLDCVVAESSMAGLVIGTLAFFTSWYFWTGPTKIIAKRIFLHSSQEVRVVAVSRGIKFTDS
jgi:hypothetical protein